MAGTELRTRTTRAGKGAGVVGILVGVLLLALLIAIAWSVFTWLLGITAMALKIAVVLLVVVLALVVVGWFRVKVLKR